MSLHKRIIISGKVQGVFFRASTRDKAIELGLHGYVMNLPNGNVLIEVKGEEQAIDELIKWAHKGSILARVNKVEVEDGDPQEFREFEIRR